MKPLTYLVDTWTKRNHKNTLCIVVVYLLSHVQFFHNSGDCSTPGSSVQGIFPGMNVRMGCHFLLQGFFLTQGLNLHFLLGRWTLYLVWCEVMEVTNIWFTSVEHFSNTEPPGKSKVMDILQLFKRCQPFKRYQTLGKTKYSYYSPEKWKWLLMNQQT